MRLHSFAIFDHFSMPIWNGESLKDHVTYSDIRQPKIDPQIAFSDHNNLTPFCLNNEHAVLIASLPGLPCFLFFDLRSVSCIIKMTKYKQNTLKFTHEMKHVHGQHKVQRTMFIIQKFPMNPEGVWPSLSHNDGNIIIQQYCMLLISPPLHDLESGVSLMCVVQKRGNMQ